MVGSHGVTVSLKNNIIFTNLSFFLVNIVCFKSPKIKNDRLGLTIFPGEGYCHIWAVKLYADVTGMVFKQFILE